MLLPSVLGAGTTAAAVSAPAAPASLSTRHVAAATPSGAARPAPAAPSVSAPIGKWVERFSAQTPPQVGSAAIAYDPQYNGSVLFGGYNASGLNNGMEETWLFANNTWTNLNSSGQLPVSPRGLWWQAMTYDPNGPYLIMFGGRNNTPSSGFVSNETWIFNLTGWHEMFPVSAPTARAYSSIFYDPVLQQVVLYGGNGRYAPTGGTDTWYWSNGTWTNETSLVGAAAAVDNPAFGWDGGLNGGLIFGGSPVTGTSPCPAINSTYLFNGSWSQVSTVGAPPAVSGLNGAYDSAADAFVLYGGNLASCGISDQTWALYNTTWVNLTSAVTPFAGAPYALCCEAMTYDPVQNELVMFGGNAYVIGPPRLNNTWTLSLPRLTASVTAQPASGPAPLNVSFTSAIHPDDGPFTYNWSFGDGSANATTANASHVYALPGAYMVNFTAVSANGTEAFGSAVVDAQGPGGWHSVATPVAPSDRGYAAIAYDPQRQGTLLFGGESDFGLELGDTWLFANGSWTNLTGSLPVSPPARWGADLVWDPAGPYMVLFGGRVAGVANTSSGSALYNDTWTFNATGWHLLSTPIAPSPREDVQWFFDPVWNQVILFGGTALAPSVGFYGFNDTWTFSGGRWTNISARLTQGSPPSTTAAGITWDPALQQAVMYGGQVAGGGCATYATTWLFGTGWNESDYAVTPGATADGPTLAYDAADAAPFLYAGEEFGPCGVRGGSWEYQTAGWSNITPSMNRSDAAPPDRFSSTLVYDQVQHDVLLFGGVGNYSMLNDTWVYPAPLFVASVATSASTGVGPFNVSFRATLAGGIGPYSTSWAFGDGSPNGSGTAVSHVFATPGAYMVVLHATDVDGRELNRTLSILVVEPLSTSLGASGTSGEAPYPVNFSASLVGGASPFQYDWAFGDGGTSTLAAPAHTYASAGTFTATVSVRDAIGEVATASVNISVVAALAMTLSPAAVKGLAPFLASLTPVISGGLAPYQVTWNFGDGANATGNLTQQHTYKDPGLYEVIASVRDQFGRELTASATVDVASPLVASLNASPTRGPAPLSVVVSASAAGGFPGYDFVWSFGDGTPNSTGQPAYHTFFTVGTFTITGTAIDSEGFTATTSATVDVVGPLTAHLAASASVVEVPATVSFAAEPTGGTLPYSYLWNFGDGSSGSTGAAVMNHTFTTAGHPVVTVTVVDADGSVTTAAANVAVDAALGLRLIATPPNVTVNTTSVSLRATVSGGAGGLAFAWSGLPLGCSARNVSSFSCLPTASGVFTVSATATDALGRHATANTTLTVTSASGGSTGPGGGGTGPLASNGPGSLLVYLIVAVAVVAAAIVAILLIRRRGRGGLPAEPEAPLEEGSLGTSTAEPGIPTDGSPPA